MIEYYLREGLKKASREATLRELGDRSTYVGSSDIAGCMRRTVMEKLNPSEPDLVTLLQFERGHMVEGILKKALDAMGCKYEYQHESVHPEAPFKAHIDFLFHGKDTDAILECKSVPGIPKTTYENWITQLHYQMGLLAMEKPGRKIRGAIFALDLNSGQEKIFNGYQFDPVIFDGLMKKAGEIWDCVCANEDDQKIRTEKGPLCAWCDSRPGCPAFRLNEDIPEVPIEEDVMAYLSLKEAAKDLDEEIRKLSETIKAAIKNTGNGKNGKIKAGNCIASLSRRSRNGLNGNLLKREMPEIYKKYSKTSSYEVLLID